MAGKRKKDNGTAARGMALPQKAKGPNPFRLSESAVQSQHPLKKANFVPWMLMDNPGFPEITRFGKSLKRRYSLFHSDPPLSVPDRWPSYFLGERIMSAPARQTYVDVEPLTARAAK
jgi:hypothetical protein